MAIEIKDINGYTHSIPSNGKANTALGLAIGALGTSLLGGGLGNILGGGNGNGGILSPDCTVSKDLFYQTLIGQINEQNARDLAVSNRMANIEAAVSQNAAVSACNKDAIRREIEVTRDTFDMTISNERVVNDLILKNALCRCIQGEVSVPFSKLTMGCLDKTHVIDTYEARPFREGHRHGGWDDGCSPCGGYRGF